MAYGKVLRRFRPSLKQVSLADAVGVVLLPVLLVLVDMKCQQFVVR